MFHPNPETITSACLPLLGFPSFHARCLPGPYRGSKLSQQRDTRITPKRWRRSMWGIFITPTLPTQSVGAPMSSRSLYHFLWSLISITVVLRRGLNLYPPPKVNRTPWCPCSDCTSPTCTKPSSISQPFNILYLPAFTQPASYHSNKG